MQTDYLVLKLFLLLFQILAQNPPQKCKILDLLMWHFSVSCEDNCPLFFDPESDAVSLCGWLQSQGYDTSNMVASSLKYNLNIQSVSSTR